MKLEVQTNIKGAGDRRSLFFKNHLIVNMNVIR